MNPHTAHPAPSRLAARLVLCASPWLIGADSCADDIRVGVEDRARSPDGGTGHGRDGSADDAGKPKVCTELDCAGPKPGEVSCEDGSKAGAACTLDTDGVCTWSPLPCPAIDGGGGPGECASYECLGPKPEVEVAASAELRCADGSEPVCMRDPTGCSYQCPVQVACATPDGMACNSTDTCVFPVGRCGGDDTSGGLCQKLPSSCSAQYDPVCGCDGQTYGNSCEAVVRGVSVAYAGECSQEPRRCERECQGPAPTAPNEPCPDGEHVSGPLCAGLPDGSCVWQVLQCPSSGQCGSSADLAPNDGRCFSDEDCELGQVCEGAILCPCDAKCFAADTPGYCK